MLRSFAGVVDSIAKESIVWNGTRVGNQKFPKSSLFRDRSPVSFSGTIR
jgi:hypothetical protein